MRVFLVVAAILLVSVEARAVPFWVFSGGSNGTTEKSSIGIEVGGTSVIMKKFPLSAELSMNFDFEDVPSDTFFNPKDHSEPYTTHNVKYGPEIGYLFKSGFNLDEWVRNLTLQVGAGYSLQSIIKVGTSQVSGKHWKEDRYTEAYPVGYGGVLYRMNNICLTLGYNNRRGLVGGIGSTW